MKKQGLIAVDLDGTLIDTVAVNAESYRRALESFGFTLDYDYYAAYCNGRHYRAFLQPLMGGSPSAEDVERVHDLKKQYYAASMDKPAKTRHCLLSWKPCAPPITWPWLPQEAARTQRKCWTTFTALTGLT